MATAPTKEADNAADDRTKPPFLRRVRIRGYKSIAYCDVQLHPLTILVGRNGSGKSNFLDALAFLRDATRFNVPEALKLHGGLQSLLCRSAKMESITIEIEVGFHTFDDVSYLANYGLTIPANGGRSPAQHQEQLLLHDATTGQEHGFRFAEGLLTWFGYGVPAEDAKPKPATTSHLLLSVVGYPPAVRLAEELESMGFYSFHPDAIRKLQKPVAGVMLDRDGGNLASVVEELEWAEPDTLKRVRDYLTVISDEVTDFHAKHYGEYETLRFRMRSASPESPLEFDAASMSDGTLRALAALVAAFQLDEAVARPSVVGIEEPESSLHPGATGALVDALDEATSRTQVLLTTHSGDLLADRDIDPFHLLVVRMRDGQTQIGPVDPGSREIIKKELATLADLQRMNQLEPDEADLQRQINSTSGNGQE